MVCDLPRTQIFDYYEADEGEIMEFRLIYQGPLPVEKCKDDGTSARARDKHWLRKQFHPQLKGAMESAS